MNCTCILGGLPLGIIEVGGHSDHCMRDVLAQVGRGRVPHLSQDHAADLLGAETFGLPLELHLHIGLCGFVHNLVCHQLGIALYLLVLEAVRAQAPISVRPSLYERHDVC